MFSFLVRNFDIVSENPVRTRKPEEKYIETIFFVFFCCCKANSFANNLLDNLSLCSVYSSKMLLPMFTGLFKVIT